MRRTQRVFLIHGWDGHPGNHWFPLLTRELIQYGFGVFAPAMPHAAEPKVSEWVAHLNKTVIYPDEQTYFVGHSLGCIATVNFLEQLPERVRVGGAVFVGGFFEDLGEPDLAEFYSSPSVIEKAKTHCGSFVSILSDNDEQVPLEKSLNFHKQLGGVLVIEKEKGHFCADDGVTELSSVLNAILDMAKISRES